MTKDKGTALEIAFDAAFDELGKENLEAVFEPAQGQNLIGRLSVFDGPQKLGSACTLVNAGKLFAKAIKD